MWGQPPSAVRLGTAQLFFSTGNDLEPHLLCCTSRLTLPLGKQHRVVLRDVVGGGYSHLLRGCVNPPRRTFDLAKVPDRCLVHHDLPLFVSPLRTEFFIPK